MSATARAATLAGIALLATALILVDPVRGAGPALVRATAAAWRGVFPDRPKPALSQRMIVVLSAPSLADHVAAAEEPLPPEEQKRLVAEAEAAQQVLLAHLRDRGIVLRPELAFTRTLNGFSANVGPRALAELERARGVVGVYPVRTVYPASLGSDTLSRAEFGPGGGRRPDVGMSAFDGRGKTIALLDTGVDHEHPYLGGRVAPGFDVVGGDQLARAEAKPDEPARLESHGTRMAGILVGSGGPNELSGIAPRARLLPIRILGWERAADGSYAVMGRADGLIAGLERAVDPDADGDVEDAATAALAAVVEPFAAFSASPEARAVAGATRLGTLVVAAAGNDGRPGDDFGTVGAPGGAPAALTVGVVDSRREVNEAPATLRAGSETLLDDAVRVVGAIAPDTPGGFAVTALTGPSLADPSRARNAVAGGGELGDFFDPSGVSRVAGRAVLLPAAGGDPDVKLRNAAAAGAAAVLIAGTPLAAGALDLDETAALPALALPADVGREALEALVSGARATITLGAAMRVANATAGRVASFSSGGLAFGGHVKPDLVAPGISIATADAGVNGDGTPRYGTATGSSAAAAMVAGAALVVSQARPGLDAAQLKGLLVGSAEELVRGRVPERVTVQGAGMLSAPAAAAAEILVEPTTLAYGRANGAGWQVAQALELQNLSIRRLEIGFGITRDAPGGPELTFSADPARVTLEPGTSTSVVLVASARGTAVGNAGGSFLVLRDGARSVRVPWAVSFRGGNRPLLSDIALSHRDFSASDAAPAVLAFRAGRVHSSATGYAVVPVGVLVAELRTAAGERLGVLARMRDLLPGRYALGLTGRGPSGKKLAPGSYVVRVRADPVPGDFGAGATAVDVPFTIR